MGCGSEVIETPTHFQCRAGIAKQAENDEKARVYEAAHSERRKAPQALQGSRRGQAVRLPRTAHRVQARDHARRSDEDARSREEDRPAHRLHLALRATVLGDAVPEGERPPRLRVRAAPAARQGGRGGGSPSSGGRVAALPLRAPRRRRPPRARRPRPAAARRQPPRRRPSGRRRGRRREQGPPHRPRAAGGRRRPRPEPRPRRRSGARGGIARRAGGVSAGAVPHPVLLSARGRGALRPGRDDPRPDDRATLEARGRLRRRADRAALRAPRRGAVSQLRGRDRARRDPGGSLPQDAHPRRPSLLREVLLHARRSRLPLCRHVRRPDRRC